jgi:hypothetical protein
MDVPFTQQHIQAARDYQEKIAQTSTASPVDLMRICERLGITLRGYAVGRPSPSSVPTYHAVSLARNVQRPQVPAWKDSERYSSAQEAVAGAIMHIAGVSC